VTAQNGAESILNSKGEEIPTKNIKRKYEANRKVNNMFEKFMKRFFDYEITGSYLDYVGNNTWRKKYKKKWHMKRKKRR